MLSRFVTSLVVGVVFALIAVIIGIVLQASGVGVLDSIGRAIEDWNILIGILAGVWYFFKGSIRL